MGKLSYIAQSTIIALAKTMGPDGKFMPIAEVLAETNDMLKDMPLYPANGINYHRVQLRSSIPTSNNWRKYNSGGDWATSTTKNIDYPIGGKDLFSRVDVWEADNAPDPAAYRTMKDLGVVEGLSQQLADALIYGDPLTTPDSLKGLAPHMESLTDPYDRVFDAGGSGSDLSSVFVVQWGPGKVYGVYPKNTDFAGITMKDLGIQLVEDSSGNPFNAYVSEIAFFLGLVVEDPRCIQRICNIETSGSTNTFDDDLLLKALNNLPGNGTGAVIYVNKTIKDQMDILAKDKTNVYYTADDAFGRPTTYFRGFPVRKMDAILNTESAIS